jgi:hypothetical protein
MRIRHGLHALGLAVMILVKNRKSRMYGGFVSRWVRGIRWVPEAIAGEHEFCIHFGESERIRGTWRQDGDD